MLSNNEQNERKSRITALAGTILFHALMLSVLLLLAFHTDIPFPQEEGVEVNLDYRQLAAVNPKSEVPQLDPDVATSSILNNPDENQDTEMPVEIPETKKKEITKPTPPKSKISIIETPEESTIIHIKPNTNKTTNTSSVRDLKTTGKRGDQPKAEGTTQKPQNAGNDGTGNTISFDLGGRGARILPKPTFKSSEDGKIVVSVKVNIQGMVVSANAGAKGTTITEPSLRKQAENAANMSLFALDMDAPEEQRGTITYIIVKQK